MKDTHLQNISSKLSKVGGLNTGGLKNNNGEYIWFLDGSDVVKMIINLQLIYKNRGIVPFSLACGHKDLKFCINYGRVSHEFSSKNSDDE